ncbi:MAG: hypothetical protein R2941_23670 [Desulfobacterales bacterium]
MAKYFFRAFVNRWNLLFLGAAAAFGLIADAADIVLPLAGAFDLLAVSFVATRPRFQAVCDHSGQAGGQGPEMSSDRVAQILAEISPEDTRKFEKLRQVCTHLLSVGKKPSEDSESDGIAAAQIGGLNRLLWIYLKLLHSKNGLEQFFRTIDRNEIEKQMQAIARRLSGMGPADADDLESAKKRESLTDTLNISETRLANYDKIHHQYELMILELDRLYAKTASLAEMAVSHQDLNTVMSDVDAAAFSVQQTTEVLNELSSFTGVSFKEEAPLTLIHVKQ